MGIVFTTVFSCLCLFSLWLRTPSSINRRISNVVGKCVALPGPQASKRTTGTCKSLLPSSHQALEAEYGKMLAPSPSRDRRYYALIPFPRILQAWGEVKMTVGLPQKAPGGNTGSHALTLFMVSVIHLVNVLLDPMPSNAGMNKESWY